MKKCDSKKAMKPMMLADGGCAMKGKKKMADGGYAAKSTKTSSESGAQPRNFGKKK